MSAPVPTRPVMANGHLFHSPLGLFPFQADAAAHAFFEAKPIVTLDLGLGKTIVSMALAAQLFEAGEIDLVMHIARRNKVDADEFPADWARFTSLRAFTYHGPNRAKKLAAAGPVDVIITTYETGRNELMRRVKSPGRSGKGGRADGPLMETLGLRHKRVLWVFDEVIKLGNRGSEVYQAYEYVINQLRRTGPKQYVVGFSATPMRTDYEQPFNIGRIVVPEKMPAVTWFEKELTYGRDDRGRLLYKKGAREWFAAQFEPLVYRKRRTDPDVASQMPRLIEKPIYVDLHPDHAALYQAVARIFGGRELTQQEEDALNIALRLVTGHPASLLRARSKVAQAVVEALGETYLRQVSSSKTLRLIEELTTIREQGDRMLAFTFYAETVLPEVAADLRAAEFTVATYTGGQSARENEAAKAAFKAGEVDVLLSSDAGSEGLNLPEAGYIYEYEVARTFDTRSQRFGRGTRLVGGGSHVYGVSMVARKTIEMGTLETVLQRNAWQDLLLGDTGATGHVDAESRRRILKGAY